MKKILVLCTSLTCFASFGQTDNGITSLDFVQILNNNREEAIYYYQNNWKVLRDWALEEKIIASYEFFQTESTPDQPFDFILRTTYPDSIQFAAREENFQRLIRRKGESRLKNELQPSDFRKILFSKEFSRHGFSVY
ncbi:MAG: hypothetical protein ABJG78_21715 [Cyclobacteriaceae bacterium]